VRERTDQISEVIVAAPQNQPTIGTLIDREDSTLSRARVEVTTVGFADSASTRSASARPAPQLALATRSGHDPPNPLLALYDTASGSPQDLVEWARELAEPEVRFTTSRSASKRTRSPRPQPRAGRRDQDVAAPDLVARLKERAAVRPHATRYLPARRGRR